jgi:ABC-type iron transport system FetAB ATPase subunit
MLKFIDYVVGYSETHRWVLHQEFEAGTIYQVLGPNGSGKSTVLKAVAGIIPPLSGLSDLSGVTVFGMPTRTKFRTFLYVPQEPEWVFVGDTFEDHLVWISRRLGRKLHAPHFSFADADITLDFKRLSASRFVDLNSDEIYFLALIEDRIFPHKFLLLDECPTFELPTYSGVLNALLSKRALRGDVTIIGRHVPLDVTATAARTVEIEAETLRLKPHQSPVANPRTRG